MERFSGKEIMMNLVRHRENRTSAKKITLSDRKVSTIKHSKIHINNFDVPLQLDIRIETGCYFHLDILYLFCLTV